MEDRCRDRLVGSGDLTRGNRRQDSKEHNQQCQEADDRGGDRLLILHNERRQRDRNSEAPAEEAQGGGSRRNRHANGPVIRIVRVGSISRIALAVTGWRVSRVRRRLSRLTLVGPLAGYDVWLLARLPWIDRRRARVRPRGLRVALLRVGRLSIRIPCLALARVLRLILLGLAALLGRITGWRVGRLRRWELIPAIGAGLRTRRIPGGAAVRTGGRLVSLHGWASLPVQLPGPGIPSAQRRRSARSCALRTA